MRRIRLKQLASTSSEAEDTTVKKLTFRRLYEGIAIVAVFLFYVQVIAPNSRIGAALYAIESQNPEERVCGYACYRKSTPR